MRRTRRDRPLGARVVLGGRDGLHGVGVAVAQLEGLRGDVGPGGNPARAGEVVRAAGARRARLAVAVAVAARKSPRPCRA